VRMRDADGQAACVRDRDRRMQAKVLTDEARRIGVRIARLPGLLGNKE